MAQGFSIPLLPHAPLCGAWAGFLGGLHVCGLVFQERVSMILLTPAPFSYKVFLCGVPFPARRQSAFSSDLIFQRGCAISGLTPPSGVGRFLPDGPRVGHLPPESAIPPHPRTTRKANPIFYPSLCTTDGTMHRDTIVDPMSQLPGHFKDNKNSCQNIIAAAIGSKSLITPGLHRSYQSQVPQKVPCQW